MIAYLGLGSNVGDRIANLRAAAERLDAAEGITVLARSSVYETEPVGEKLDQRDFYNAVLRVETSLDPRALLAACKGVERQLGRDPRVERHSPRTIDVDLLLVGDLTLDNGDLTLPHREVTSRRFVLEPLLELDPELKLPDRRSLRDAHESLGTGQRVTLVAALD